MGSKGLRQDGLPYFGTPEFKAYIGNRDGWICGLCKLTIDPNLTVYESDWAAVIDHVIPRWAGGSNDTNNLRITHYECNRLKNKHKQFALSQEQLATVNRCVAILSRSAPGSG